MAYIDDLTRHGDQLLEKRGQLLALWQTISENFYPERADFNTIRNVGTEFAKNLMTSYPILARRDLGNTIGSMLRPTSKDWFHIKVRGMDELGYDAKVWLEKATKHMRRAMFSDRRNQFSRATKEADHDFAAFGQCVLQISTNRDRDGLLYRCWHLRDCAWTEDSNGQVSTVVRKWKITAVSMCSLFPNAHSQVKTAMDKDPYKEFQIRHVIMPIEDYKGDGDFKTPFVSIYYDADNKHILEEVGILSQEYLVPRWSMASGTQYAYSPATVAALPDARLIQSMTRVLLEAGEKAVTPPMIAVQEAIRGDIGVYAGGITWVDAAYDERLGEVLRPITQDKSGIPLGGSMAVETRNMIAEAFYLNKVSLPPPGQDMTAYEVGQRVQEYIRQAMPLFAPIEEEYNSPLCEKTFEIMLRLGAFGSPFDMPPELHGANIDFQFESPLHDAVEREKGQRFMEAHSMIAQAQALDPGATDLLDASKALRDVLESIGVPVEWTRPEEEVAQMQQDRLRAQQQAQTLALMQGGANVAKTLQEASPTGGTQAQPSPVM